MLALLKDVPVINHPVFRLVVGAALIAVGLVLNHIIITVAGALLVLLGLARAYHLLTTHHQKGQVQ
jgi:hypothetical protein